MQIVEVVKSFAIIGWSGGISRTHLDSWLRVANFVLLSFFFLLTILLFRSSYNLMSLLEPKGKQIRAMSRVPWRPED